MDDDAAKETLDGFLAQLKFFEERIRTISREIAIEEASEVSKEQVSKEQINLLVDQINKVVEEIACEIETLRYDLRWLLAIPRAYRALRKRLASSLSYPRVVRAGKVLAVLASAITIVHYAYGWPRVFSWLAKKFTGQ